MTREEAIRLTAKNTSLVEALEALGVLKLDEAPATPAASLTGIMVRVAPRSGGGDLAILTWAGATDIIVALNNAGFVIFPKDPKNDR